MKLILKLLFVFKLITFSSGNNYVSRIRGIFDSIPIIKPIQKYIECATDEGYPGVCKAEQFSCSNLGNYTKTLCPEAPANPIASKNNTYCCPVNPENQLITLPVPSFQCGQRFPNYTRYSDETTGQDMLIVGGEPVNPPYSYPWMILVYARGMWEYGNGQFICGGAIINEWYVVTAAHCVMDFYVYKVRIGVYDYSVPTDGTFIDVATTKVHENYRQISNKYDIALFKLKKKIEWHPRVAPVCLPALDMEDPAPGTNATLIGWGATSEGGSVSKVLREVQVPIISNEECRNAYANDSIDIGPDQICAAYPEGGKDTCQGDSGGPLLIPYNGTYYEYGVVSFGIGCARPGYPGVYTRVSYKPYLYWIGVHTSDV